MSAQWRRPRIGLMTPQILLKSSLLPLVSSSLLSTECTQFQMEWSQKSRAAVQSSMRIYTRLYFLYLQGWPNNKALNKHNIVFFSHHFVTLSSFGWPFVPLLYLFPLFGTFFSPWLWQPWRPSDFHRRCSGTSCEVSWDREDESCWYITHTHYSTAVPHRPGPVPVPVPVPVLEQMVLLWSWTDWEWPPDQTLTRGKVRSEAPGGGEKRFKGAQTSQSGVKSQMQGSLSRLKSRSWGGGRYWRRGSLRNEKGDVHLLSQ